MADNLHQQQQCITSWSQNSAGNSTPHLVIASAAGLYATTKHSMHLSSAESIALTAKQDVSIATEDSFFVSVAQTLRLFAKNAGIKLLAAAGNISIIAKKDEVEVVAAKILALISENDWIELKGKKGIRLIGAGSTIEISDKVQFFTASPTLFHGNLETLSPSTKEFSSDQPSKDSTSTKQTFDEQFRIVGSDGVTPVSNCKYRITADDGQTWEGRSDGQGLTQRVTTQTRVKLSLLLIPD